LTELRAALTALRSALAEHAGSTSMEEARHAQDALLPAMAAVRAAADALEHIVADDLWPLPTYQEMLYVL
jgi:glutamine synthetase